MKAIYLYKDNVKAFEKGIAVAIGYFDGFHIGHQSLIDEVLDYGSKHDLETAVITFSPNPSYKIGVTKDPTLITPIPEKERILGHTDIDYLLVINFDDDVMNMSKEDFIRDFLMKLNIKYLVCGTDWRYGIKGSGDADYISNYSDELKVNVMDLLTIDSIKVSSSNIKELIRTGELGEVKKLLGRPYSLKGEVIHGNKRGREIGFPTANVLANEEYIIPGKGVYIAEVKVDGKWYKAMINVGNNPTFNARINTSIEAHILNFSKNIYGENIRINFLERIRDEKKFSGIDELVLQLNDDLNKVNTYFELYTYQK